MFYNISNRIKIQIFLVFSSVFLPWKAMAGSLIALFSVSGVITTLPSWYDNGTLINTPSNSPNQTIVFTFGRGLLSIPDGNGNFTTDTRNESVSNPNGILAIQSILVTLPSACRIGNAATTDGSHPVDTSMSIIIGGNAPHTPNTSGQVLVLTTSEVNGLTNSSPSAPSASSGSQVYLSLAHLNGSGGNTGAISCGSPGNFTVSF